MEITHRKDRRQGLRTFIRLYPLFKSERLTANIKLTLLKALIRSVMTYVLSRLGICCRNPPTDIASPAKSSTHHWKFSKAYIGTRFACDFPNLTTYDYITKLCRQQAEII
jgi:hypothetical protein